MRGDARTSDLPDPPPSGQSTPLMSRWLRAVLTFALTLAAWVVVVPARAATTSNAEPPIAGGRAPLCDDRAASMFAPAPQLQAPETSIDLGDAADECLSSFLEDGVAHQGGDAPRSTSPTPDSAITVLVPPITPAPYIAAIGPRPDFFAAPPGVQTRLDRPPRF